MGVTPDQEWFEMKLERMENANQIRHDKLEMHMLELQKDFQQTYMRKDLYEQTITGLTERVKNLEMRPLNRLNYWFLAVSIGSTCIAVLNYLNLFPHLH